MNVCMHEYFWARVRVGHLGFARGKSPSTTIRAACACETRVYVKCMHTQRAHACVTYMCVRGYVLHDMRARICAALRSQFHV